MSGLFDSGGFSIADELEFELEFTPLTFCGLTKNEDDEDDKDDKDDNDNNNTKRKGYPIDLNKHHQVRSRRWRKKKTI